MKDKIDSNPAGRDPHVRLLRTLAITFFLWLASCLTATVALDKPGGSTAVRAAFAWIAIVAFVPLLIAIGRSVVAQDEFTQRVHLVALGWAFAATALASYGIYFLHAAGLAPSYSIGGLWMVMGVIWWCSIIASAWYYR